MNRFMDTNSGLWGLKNDEGQIITPATYMFIDDFCEDLAIVQVRDKWGAIDKKGKIVISPQFSWASELKKIK